MSLKINSVGAGLALDRSAEEDYFFYGTMDLMCYMIYVTKQSRIEKFERTTDSILSHATMAGLYSSIIRKKIREIQGLQDGDPAIDSFLDAVKKYCTQGWRTSYEITEFQDVIYDALAKGKTSSVQFEQDGRDSETLFDEYKTRAIQMIESTNQILTDLSEASVTYQMLKNDAGIRHMGLLNSLIASAPSKCGKVKMFHIMRRVHIISRLMDVRYVVHEEVDGSSLRVILGILGNARANPGAQGTSLNGPNPPRRCRKSRLIGTIGTDGSDEEDNGDPPRRVTRSQSRKPEERPKPTTTTTTSKPVTARPAPVTTTTTEPERRMTRSSGAPLVGQLPPTRRAPKKEGGQATLKSGRSLSPQRKPPPQKKQSEEQSDKLPEAIVPGEIEWPDDTEQRNADYLSEQLRKAFPMIVETVGEYCFKNDSNPYAVLVVVLSSVIQQTMWSRVFEYKQSVNFMSPDMVLFLTQFFAQGLLVRKVLWDQAAPSPLPKTIRKESASSLKELRAKVYEMFPKLFPVDLVSAATLSSLALTLPFTNLIEPFLFQTSSTTSAFAYGVSVTVGFLTDWRAQVRYDKLLAGKKEEVRSKEWRYMYFRTFLRMLPVFLIYFSLPDFKHDFSAFPNSLRENELRKDGLPYGGGVYYNPDGQNPVLLYNSTYEKGTLPMIFRYTGDRATVNGIETLTSRMLRDMLQTASISSIIDGTNVVDVIYPDPDEMARGLYAMYLARDYSHLDKTVGSYMAPRLADRVIRRFEYDDTINTLLFWNERWLFDIHEKTMFSWLRKLFESTPKGQFKEEIRKAIANAVREAEQATRESAVPNLKKSSFPATIQRAKEARLFPALNGSLSGPMKTVHSRTLRGMLQYISEYVE